MTWAFFGGKRKFDKKSGNSRRKNKSSVPGRRRPHFEALEQRNLLAVLTVNNDDGGAVAFGDASLTLREAIAVVNAGSTVGLGLSQQEQNQLNSATPLGTNDVIQFDNVLSTIRLGSELRISNSVTILGADVDDLILDGKSLSRIFNISAGYVSINNITLKNGAAGFGNDGGAIFSTSLNPLELNSTKITNSSARSGGAIYATGEIVLSGVQIGGSAAEANTTNGGNGGGVYAGGNITLYECEISYNSTNSVGGGIYAESNAAIYDSEFSNNSSNQGGAIGAAGSVFLRSSTVSTNTAMIDGGGIFAGINVTAQQSTIANNTAGDGSTSGGDGGGIWAGKVTLRNSTVAKNRALDGSPRNGDGGGIWGVTVIVQNSTIAENYADQDEGTGGGIFARDKLAINNSIIVGNHDNNDTANDRTYPDINKPSQSLSVFYSLIGDLGSIDSDGMAGEQFEVLGATQQSSQFKNFIGKLEIAISMDDVLETDNNGDTAVLANNNGVLPLTTETIKLIGVAINKGSNALAFDPNGSDQRGLPFDRIAPTGGTVDMGAFEVQEAAPDIVVVVDESNYDVPNDYYISLGSLNGTRFVPITIFNSGSADLHLTSIALTGDLAEFALIQPASTTIPVNHSVDFNITFTPIFNNATREATLTILSDDPNETPFTIVLQGVGKGIVAPTPEINVQVNDANVISGDTAAAVGPTHTPVNIQVKIQNNGSADLNLTDAITSNNPSFVVTPPAAGAIAKDGSRTFTVTFTPTADGLQNAKITIPNDDGTGNESPYNIFLQGTGTGFSTPAPELDFSDAPSKYGSASHVITGNTIKLGSIRDAESSAYVSSLADGDDTHGMDDEDGLAAAPPNPWVPGQSVHLEFNTPNAIGSFLDAWIDWNGDGVFADAGEHIVNNSFPVDGSVFASNFTVPAGATPGETYMRLRVSSDQNLGPTGQAADGEVEDYRIVITAAAPEINVRFNNDSVPDGDTASNIGATSTSTTVPFLIQNVGGTAPLIISSIEVIGTHASEFVVSPLASNTIAPNADIIAMVTFTPKGNGTRTATIRINNNDSDEDSYEVTLVGTAFSVVTGAPEITVLGNTTHEITNGDTTPDAADHTDFGTVTQGAVLTRTFTIRNDGGTDLTGVAVTVPAGFTLTTSPPTTVGAGGTTTFIVRLDTATSGLKSGDVSIASNDSDENPFKFKITGTVNPTATPAEITVLGNTTHEITNGDTTPDAADHTDFGTVTQGAVLTRTFTIRNDGGTDLTGVAVTVPAGFTLTTSPPTTVGAGGTTTFIVRLDTATSGLKSGDVSIASNDSDENPFKFKITGTVNPTATPAEITVLGNTTHEITNGDTTPDAADHTDFGTVTQGAAPISRTFTIHNSGGMDLTVGAVTVPTGFTVTTPPPATVAAGGTATFIVRLDTTSSGAKTGDVSIVNNDADENPFNFRISGTVNPPLSAGPPEIEVLGKNVSIDDGDTTPSATDDTDFGTVIQGGAPISHTFTIHNSGGTDLTVGTVTVPAGFTVTTPPPATVGAGDTTTFIVQLDTAILGTKSGDVSIVTNDADENPFNFRITGTVSAVAPPAEIEVLGKTLSIDDGDTTPSATDDTDFGSVIQGGAAISHTFTIQNSGGTALTVGAVTVPAGFTVTTPPPATVGAGDTATFTVRLDTTTTGIKSGEVSIVNNDSDENPFNFQITGTVNQVADTNLALNKPVTFSSQEVNAGVKRLTNEATEAVDGNVDTRWCATEKYRANLGGWVVGSNNEPTDPPYLQVDLGRVASVSSVNITWEFNAAGLYTYRLLTSDDGTTWVPVGPDRTNTGATDTIAFTPVSAQFVKIEFVALTHNKKLTGVQYTGASIREFEVIGH